MKLINTLKKVKKILLTTALGLALTNINAEPLSLNPNKSNKHSISVTGLAYSKHKAKGLNESHKWKGVQYGYKYSDSLDLKIEYGNFTNSYSDNTSMLVFGGTKQLMSFSTKNTKTDIGLSFMLGVQKGYCVKGIKTQDCKKNLDGGVNNISPILIPSLEINETVFKGKDYEQEIGVNITYAEALLLRFRLKLREW